MYDKDNQVLHLPLLQQQVDADRKRRSEEHEREVKEFLFDQKVGAGRLNLYVDGDSWFDYPLYKDIKDWIKRDGNPQPIINPQAHWGDSAVERMGLAKRQRLIANLSAAHGTYDALLFSAGGNDIAGDQFVLWIVKYMAGLRPANGIDRQRLASMFGVIKAAYDDLIEIRDQYAPNCLVFLHGYDFPYPSGKPACAGIGPWLKPSLDFQGWTDFALATEVVKEALKAFELLLIQIAYSGKHRKVIYVPTQGTLTSPADWDNELHPTAAGFEKIAAKFIAALRKEFPGRI